MTAQNKTVLHAPSPEPLSALTVNLRSISSHFLTEPVMSQHPSEQAVPTGNKHFLLLFDVKNITWAQSLIIVFLW